MRFDASTADQTYLKPAQAARILRVSVMTLKRLRLRGMIAHYRPSPRRILFTNDHLEDYRAQKTFARAA